jgi:subtilisin family serine protease
MAKSKKGSRGNSRRGKKDTEAAAAAERVEQLFELEQSIELDTQPQGAGPSGPTGRLMAIVPTRDPQMLSSAVATLRADFSLKSVYNSRDSAAAMDRDQMDDADMIVFQDFGIVVIKSDPDRRASVASSAAGQGLIVEREYWRHAMGFDSPAPFSADVDDDVDAPRMTGSLDYFRGFRDGLSRMIESLEPSPGLAPGLAAASDFSDSATATWGLQATGVLGSALSGAGVRVAVLDSGFDVTHPDFAGRSVTSESFVVSPYQGFSTTDTSAVIDRSGHGTHCIGTACGPKTPTSGPRYGVAYNAEIFNAKVMAVFPGDPRAAGADSWILRGIDWAVKNKCSIISMSFGGPSPTPVNGSEPVLEPFSAYAKTARAYENDVLMIAAAGNESIRHRSIFKPVAMPASCPRIISVAALQRLTLPGGKHRVADFSNRALYNFGGEINLSGPGVEIHSSFPDRRHRLMDGTSQATPHVAGIAALIQEQTGLKGMALYAEVKRRAIRQHADPLRADVDYGNGLVHV